MPKNDLVLQKIGTDPEYFLFDYKKGTHVYPGRYIKGSKDKPFIFDDFGRTIQIDTCCVENTMPPEQSASKLWNHIQECFKYLNTQLPEHVTYDLIPWAEFPETELYEPSASMSGCTPSWSAWKCEVNSSPQMSKFGRSAGGHIHIGLKHKNGEDLSMMDECMVIRACDLFWGVPSVIIDNSPESKKRKSIYGQAGECRFADDRVEYRTLSNFWLNNEEYVQWFFDTASDIIRFVNSGKAYSLDSSDNNDIVRCINTGNEELAQRIIERYKIDFPVVHQQKMVAA